VSEVLRIRWDWDLYRFLYGVSQERIALLDRTGTLVFRRLHWLLLDHVLLGVCRITEPGKGRNLTLETLIDQTREPKHAGLVSRLHEHLAEARARRRSIKQRRDRMIAHTDLKIALEAKPLSELSRAKISKAFEPIVAFLKAYGDHFGRPSHSEPAALLMKAEDAGKQLLHALKLAAHCQDLSREEEFPLKPSLRDRPYFDV